MTPGGVTRREPGSTAFLAWDDIDSVESGEIWNLTFAIDGLDFSPLPGIWLRPRSGARPRNRRLTPLWRRGRLSRRGVFARTEYIAVKHDALRRILTTLARSPQSRTDLASPTMPSVLMDPRSWLDRHRPDGR